VFGAVKPAGLTLFAGVFEARLCQCLSNTFRVSFVYIRRVAHKRDFPFMCKRRTFLGPEGCPFRIALIGDGPEGPSLQALISCCGLDPVVDFLDFGMRPQIAQLTSAVSVLMSSLGEYAAPLRAGADDSKAACHSVEDRRTS
jgi:hypothetical protein